MLPHSLGGVGDSHSPVGRPSGSCSPNSAASYEGGITGYLSFTYCRNHIYI